MEWKDTPEQGRFRNEVRTFIKERFPAGYRPDPRMHQSLEPEDVFGYDWPADRKSPDPERREGAQQWARALAERGWVAPHWPKEYGGAGLGIMDDFILTEEMAKAGVPSVGGVGANLLGPTLIQHGNEAQKREHLPRIVAGEVVWAQGFSEPEAGSDLASLKTSAIRDGDSYILNGQKIWTSFGHHADWLFALVRTDPEAPKHRGISFLMMEMDTPGITVRPIVDPRGGKPFSEVFFDDVRVPVSNRVGEENRGWYVAMATLDFERSGIGGTIKYRRELQRLIEFIRSDEGKRYLRADVNGALRHEIAQRYIEIEVLYHLGLRTVSMQAGGEMPSHEASVALLFGSEVHQRLAATGMKAFGLWGNLWQHGCAPLEGLFTHDYLDAAPHTVLSGTSEIQRNVIATRGLGLPRD
jgi:alkylation response protein AidB-like acyl-CoA dehydrogenase